MDGGPAPLPRGPDENPLRQYEALAEDVARRCDGPPREKNARAGSSQGPGARSTARSSARWRPRRIPRYADLRPTPLRTRSPRRRLMAEQATQEARRQTRIGNGVLSSHDAMQQMLCQLRS